MITEQISQITTGISEKIAVQKIFTYLRNKESNVKIAMNYTTLNKYQLIS